MKYIEKSKDEPKEFDKWRKFGGWDASAPKNKSWNSMALNLKQQIKELLLKEQGFICCYCEERITSKSSHIEHLLPKGKPKYQGLKSNYSNLLCSCNHQSCGNVKGNKEIKVHPLIANCGDLFWYTDDGRIKGVDQDAEGTISTLKLNSERLNASRREIIDVFLYELDVVTLSEYDAWIQDYLKQDDDGCFRRFWATVRYIAERYRKIYG